MFRRQSLLAVSFIICCTPITARSTLEIKIGGADIGTFIQKHTDPIIGALGIAIAAPLFIFGVHKAVDSAFPKKDHPRKNAGCKATLDMTLASVIFYVCAKKMGLFGTSEIAPKTN